jgi:GntR family transcriptional regulator, transcriptional repressor for pyruvate dehydrogenase complex
MASVPTRRMSPIRRERLYEILAARISDFIEAQGLVGGDRLPPERQLAAELGVSRATLSQALAALETRGRIEVRHGVGALVRDLTPSMGSAPGPLDEELASRPQGEVYAARETILAGIARGAAAHPQASLRLAMLAYDGRPRSFEHTWRCIRRLAEASLLSDLDDILAEKAPDPLDSPRLRASLDALADAVVRGDGSAAATACLGQLTS